MDSRACTVPLCRSMGWDPQDRRNKDSKALSCSALVNGPGIGEMAISGHALFLDDKSLVGVPRIGETAIPGRSMKVVLLEAPGSAKQGFQGMHGSSLSFNGLGPPGSAKQGFQGSELQCSCQWPQDR